MVQQYKLMEIINYMEHQIYQLKRLQSAGADPLATVDAMEGTTVIENQTLTLDNLSVGEYSVRITSVAEGGSGDSWILS